MTDSPILFNAPMVRAILREIENPGMGKTQHRRFLTLDCEEPPAIVDRRAIIAFDENEVPYIWPNTFAIGDRLWVQEEFYLTDDGENESVVYTAHEDDVTEHIGTIAGIKHQLQLSAEWAKSHLEVHPPKKMPRWASRLTLEVTDVRVERLQDITRDDCIAEGCAGWVAYDLQDGVMPEEEFKDLWDGINRKRAGCAWGDNPWVGAYTFKPHLCNIDQMGGAA